MLRHAIAALAAALVLASADPAAAQRVRAGTLTCDVSAGIGFIIGSRKQVFCNFMPDLPAPPQAYEGAFSRLGLDIGITGGGVMVWLVFTSTVNPGPGFLAGDYIGASGEATVAAGLGANVLIGGSGQTVALQPLSVSGQVGLNLALGIGDLSLRPR
jgi:hypothetical protein